LAFLKLVIVRNFYPRDAMLARY